MVRSKHPKFSVEFSLEMWAEAAARVDYLRDGQLPTSQSILLNPTAPDDELEDEVVLEHHRHAVLTPYLPDNCVLLHSLLVHDHLVSLLLEIHPFGFNRLASAARAVAKLPALRTLAWFTGGSAPHGMATSDPKETAYQSWHAPVEALVRAAPNLATLVIRHSMPRCERGDTVQALLEKLSTAGLAKDLTTLAVDGVGENFERETIDAFVAQELFRHWSTLETVRFEIYEHHAELKAIKNVFLRIGQPWDHAGDVLPSALLANIQTLADSLPTVQKLKVEAYVREKRGDEFETEAVTFEADGAGGMRRSSSWKGTTGRRVALAAEADDTIFWDAPALAQSWVAVPVLAMANSAGR